MKPIVTFPKGSITAKDKLALCKAGYVPVETDVPLNITIPSDLIAPEAFARCAMRAIHTGSDTTTKSRFIEYLNQAINPPTT
jgi:hypothetical protein